MHRTSVYRQYEDWKGEHILVCAARFGTKDKWQVNSRMQNLSFAWNNYIWKYYNKFAFIIIISIEWANGFISQTKNRKNFWVPQYLCSLLYCDYHYWIKHPFYISIELEANWNFAQIILSLCRINWSQFYYLKILCHRYERAGNMLKTIFILPFVALFDMRKTYLPPRVPSTLQYATMSPSVVYIAEVCVFRRNEMTTLWKNMR